VTFVLKPQLREFDVLSLLIRTQKPASVQGIGGICLSAPAQACSRSGIHRRIHPRVRRRIPGPEGRPPSKNRPANRLLMEFPLISSSNNHPAYWAFPRSALRQGGRERQDVVDNTPVHPEHPSAWWSICSLCNPPILRWRARVGKSFCQAGTTTLAGWYCGLGQPGCPGAGQR